MAAAGAGGVGQSAGRTPVPRTPPHASRPASDVVASPRRSHRNPSIEGLRAVAIVSIVLYHLGTTWLPSGHMGVVIFFVLTGYLVSCSLMREHARTGAVAPARFWLRRLRRVWPAMAVMVVVVCALCVLLDHVLLTKMRPDIIPSLAFASNWSYIVRGVSYFQQIGGPSPLTHLWFLGVSEQLCLVWPLVMLLVLRHGGAHVWARRACLAGAVASALLMAVLYDPAADSSRVYYGTDTRAFAFLLGAWLAFAWPVGGRPRVRVPSQRVVGACGAAAATALVAMMVLVPSTSDALYRGGMLLVAALTVVLLAALQVPGSAMARVLSARPLAWLGSRSFGIYLWHYPIIQLLGAGTTEAPWWLKALAVALSVGAAELSWRLVERPFAEGRPAAFLRSLRTADRPTRRAAILSHKAVLSACVIVLGIALVGCAVVPDETLVPADAIKSTGVDAASAMNAEQRAAARASVTATTSTASSAVSQQALSEVESADLSTTLLGTLHASSDETIRGQSDPLVVADSIMGDAQDAFEQAFPDGLLDSYVGRRPDQALAVLEDYLSQGVVGHVVVLSCFSNNIVTDDELQQMIDACGTDREVYLVNTFMPDEEQDTINQILADAAATHDNVHLVDWNSVATGHDEYLWADKTHPNETGQPVYMNMLLKAIAGDVIDAGGSLTTPTTEAAATAAADGSTVLRASDADRVAGHDSPLLIGDSVPGDLGDAFYQEFPDGLTDCVVGRRPEQLKDVYQQYVDQGVVGDVVVFAGFSNTTPRADTLEDLIAAVGSDKQVYLVGIVEPYGFQDTANANLSAAADAYDNVHFVDWASACAGHEADYLYDDHTHLTPDGQAAYLSMIAQAVSGDLVKG
ncbi:MAG: acyltransferase [Atopobiaceae bacterium]|nr:acyltransferase [Atopobiaceae bacterium]MCH4180534.1 acyltransferase [Atopobiaceae bacterium]MCH4214259.1 acyltransferase [Atopobiaceae bacterium]